MSSEGTIDVQKAILLMMGAMMALFIVYPIGRLSLYSFTADGLLSFDNYMRALGDHRSYVALGNSLYVGIATTLLCLIIGIALAWLIVRTNLPFKRTFRSLGFLALISPTYIGAIAWLQLLGHAGYLNRTLMMMFNLNAPPIEVYSLQGILFVMTLHMYPFVFLIMSNSLTVVDRSLEDASSVFGATPLRSLSTVVGPLVLPSAVSAASLVFLRSISAFGIPAIFGLPTGNYVLTTRIYAALNSYDLGLATALSVLLLVVCSLALTLNERFLGHRRFTTTTSVSRRPVPISLGRWRTVITVSIFLFFAFTTLLPLATILSSSLLRAWGLPFTASNLTISNYVSVLFKESLTMRAITNGFMFAAVSATIAVIASSLISYISARSRLPGRAVLTTLGSLPLAIPGPVMAIALILSFMDPPIELYNTPLILIIGYVVSFMPLALRNSSGVLRSLDPSLEEAARSSGASWLRSLMDVVFPLVKPGILSGWILVFLFVLREIPLSVMLHTTGTETIGVLLFSLRTGEGGLEEVSALAMVIIVLTIAGSLIVQRLGGKLEIGR
jgi:iron(III) transport system permease protein